MSTLIELLLVCSTHNVSVWNRRTTMPYSCNIFLVSLEYFVFMGLDRRCSRLELGAIFFSSALTNKLMGKKKKQSSAIMPCHGLASSHAHVQMQCGSFPNARKKGNGIANIEKWSCWQLIICTESFRWDKIECPLSSHLFFFLIRKRTEDNVTLLLPY